MTGGDLPPGKREGAHGSQTEGEVGAALPGERRGRLCKEVALVRVWEAGQELAGRGSEDAIPSEGQP